MTRDEGGEYSNAFFKEVEDQFAVIAEQWEMMDEVAHGRGEQELGYIVEDPTTVAPWLLQGPWYLELPIQGSMFDFHHGMFVHLYFLSDHSSITGQLFLQTISPTIL